MNRMEDSILITVKKMLGLDSNYTAFDTDIVVFINTAMMTLQQIGVGPLNGFTVTGATETWEDFLPSDMMLEGVKTYIYLSVKMTFDPPATSFVMDAMKQQKEELTESREALKGRVLSRCRKPKRIFGTAGRWSVMEWFGTLLSVLVGAFIVIFVMKIFGDDDGRWM